MNLNTSTMIAWYYVGVMVLLFGGQTYLLKNAHKEAVVKLTAQYEQKLKAAGMPAAAEIVAQAATPAPTAAPAAAPAMKTIEASPAPAQPAPVPVAKPSDAAAIKTLVASSADKPAARPSSQSSSSTRLPVVPVKVAFRSEPFQKGHIVLVTNTSKLERAYTLKVTRPSTGESESFKVAVPPSAEKRFAGEGDWAFKQGDRVEIALAGFAPQTHAIP